MTEQINISDKLSKIINDKVDIQGKINSRIFSIEPEIRLNKEKTRSLKEDLEKKIRSLEDQYSKNNTKLQLSHFATKFIENNNKK